MFKIVYNTNENKFYSNIKYMLFNRTTLLQQNTRANQTKMPITFS